MLTLFAVVLAGLAENIMKHGLRQIYRIRPIQKSHEDFGLQSRYISSMSVKAMIHHGHMRLSKKYQNISGMFCDRVVRYF